MSKVCRIVCSKNLNKGKYSALKKQAKLLGALRKEVWQRFGSIHGVGISFRNIRNDWVKTRDFTPLSAKAWKETLSDVLNDINLYEEAVKEKVRKDIWKRTNNKKEQKRLFGLLKYNRWVSNTYLCRRMRKYKKHGKTMVNNQIIVESGVYSQFQGKKGNTYLKIPSLIRGKPICIPLNSSIMLRGTLRIILKNGIVYIHYTMDKLSHKPCGDLIIGVDKGYTEAFADSENNFYGENFGKVLTDYTETVNSRGQSRNKLYSLLKKLEGKLEKTNLPHRQKQIKKKIRNIKKFNLGQQKLTHYREQQQKQVRNIAFQAVHQMVDSAKEIRAEDLSSPIASKQKWRQYNRSMSGWAKGSLAEALESVTKARGSCLRLVNCAYTSQMDSNTDCLEGQRVSDKFYHVNGEVSHADTNAAINIKHRGDDTEITRYMPFRKVKEVLLSRLMANGGVSSFDSVTAPP
jgi:hypothetical protein